MALARYPSFHILELSRNGQGEQPVTAVCHDHFILNAYAETLCREVNAGLNRKHSTHRNGLLVVARVVDIEADEVTEPMDEIGKVAGSAQRFFGDMLEVRHGDTGLDGG